MNKEKYPYPVFPIGLAYLAKSIENNGHQSTLLDLAIDSDLAIELNRLMAKPDLIGLSLRNIDNMSYFHFTDYNKDLNDTILLCKKMFNDVPIVLGGSGFSLFPYEIMNSVQADYGIVGEGELALNQLIYSLNQKIKIDPIDLEKISGLVYKNINGQWRQNSVNRSDSWQALRPERQRLNYEWYLINGGMANVQTKRGCCFDCIYCTYPQLDGKKLSVRPPSHIGDELEYLAKELNVDFVYFVDDIFNFPMEHGYAICNEIIQRKLKLRWTAFINPGYVDEQLIYQMKRAGCQGLELGSDSGSEKILKNLRKNFTIEHLKHCDNLAKKYRLPICHYLLFGAPGESSETVNETIKLMEQLDSAAFIAMIGIRVYPQTVLAKEYMSNPENGAMNWLDRHFFIPEKISLLEIKDKLLCYASQNPRWIIPDTVFALDETLQTKLRLRGKRGPLWELAHLRNVALNL
jgi:radical SAM superfamily enzyme YgiQ (UPF0313 family)